MSAWCRRFTAWVRERTRSRRRWDSSRITTASSSTATSRRPAVRSPTTATAWASVGSFLRPWPVSIARTRVDSFDGTSTTRSPSETSRCARFSPTPVAPSTAHVRSGHRFTSASIRR